MEEQTKQMVIECVCREYGISSDMLFLQTRKREVSEPRHVSASLLTVIFGKTQNQEQICETLSIHNRSMVSYSRKKISDLLQFNRGFQYKVYKIIDSLEASEEDKTLWREKLFDYKERPKKKKLRPYKIIR